MQKGAKQYDEACVSGRDGPWRAGGRRHRYGGGRQEHAEPRRAPDGPACRPQDGPHEGRLGGHPGPVSSKRGAAKKPHLFFILDFYFIYVIFNIIKPKIIITFGNQVSSIILNKKISVSENRKKCHKIQINKNEYKVYPVYYPVGNGIFNIDKSIEDIKWIIENEIKKEEQNLLCEIL